MAWDDPTPPAMHIFNWARNSQEHWKMMIAGRSYPDKGNFAGAKGYKMFETARATLNDMKRANEAEAADYTATDILAAAVLMLEWDGES